MKMEVLSVQNQYQGQFGVIGSNKVKDWASPLTPAPPPPQQTTTHQSPKRGSNSGKKQTNVVKQENTQSGDVVDGRQPTTDRYYQHQQQQQQSQQQQRIRNRQPLQPIKTAMEAAATTALEGASNARYSYNNNLLYGGEPTPEHNGDIDIATVAALHFDIGSPNDNVDAAAITKLSQRLQDELRAAKSRHLSGTEVTLPGDLTSRIAAEIIKTSEREPCGVRGCAIFIGFEEEPNNIRRFASFKLDADTVSTFELYLTLKLDRSGWTSLLPQFLKNLTRSSTILISPDFTLTKNKLYSCE